ncbi:hypothetical protein ONZ43_g7013 [Nemania bipapillata]|uniref:Uncharacterized protein n=1 Tax=Nemania bipapillata TaxID=110536 RepID=A0ACC2HUX4_9PEZI|nr:hypothetical protein ONZ43_g7013 [Nemania bipapillata]
MAAVLTFILNAVGLASFGLFVSDIAKGDKGVKDLTFVELIVGSGDPTMGGAVPSIALWNENGDRLGQYKRTSNKYKEGHDGTIMIEHDQTTGGSAQQTAYIMLSNVDVDAICISAIYITDAKLNTVFFGDIGQLCGMSWGISNRDIGDEHMRPKCVWLDGDGTNGINAQAMSFHLPDVVGNPDRLAQYQERRDTLCNSTPRFSFWGDLLPDSEIPFFDPQLQYQTDSSNGGLGADVDPDRVLDKPGQFDKSVSLYQGGKAKLRRSGHGVSADSTRAAGRRGLRKQRRNRKPDTLIVTPYPDHSARELCNSTTSWGPDTVSLNERLFCDMETKSLFPLCGDNGVITFCFDLQTERMIFASNSTMAPQLKLRSGGVPVAKQYASTAYW